jgi:hypothetical protein
VKGVAQSGRDARELPESVEPASGGILGQMAPRWLAPREIRCRRAAHTVNEVGQDRESSHPICQYVVEYDDQGARIPGEPADQGGCPRGLVERKRVGYGASGHPKEGLLVTGLGTGNIVDVSDKVEFGIIDPYRSAATEWC